MVREEGKKNKTKKKKTKMNKKEYKREKTYLVKCVKLLYRATSE